MGILQRMRDIKLCRRIDNKMERINEEVRDRERMMRSLKRTDTPILNGVQIFNNFIRPHEGLNGDTHIDRNEVKFGEKPDG